MATPEETARRNIEHRDLGINSPELQAVSVKKPLGDEKSEGELSLGNTSDLLNLSKAVGSSISPKTALKAEDLNAIKAISQEEVARIIGDGEPVSNPAELLARMINPGK